MIHAGIYFLLTGSLIALLSLVFSGGHSQQLDDFLLVGFKAGCVSILGGLFLIVVGTVTLIFLGSD